MTAHDELTTLYALRRRALAGTMGSGGAAPAGLGAIGELIEARERRFLDGGDGPTPSETARTLTVAEALAARAA